MRRFFSNFKNGPAWSQTSPNNSLIIASAGLMATPFEVIDWQCGKLPVARQPNYSLWQVDLCAAVGTVRTDVVHTGELPAMQTNMWMEGEKGDWLMCTFLWEIVVITIHCNWRRRNKLSLLGRPLAADVGLINLLLISAHDEGVMYRSHTFAVCRSRWIAIWTKCMIQCFPFVGLDHK